MQPCVHFLLGLHQRAGLQGHVWLQWVYSLMKQLYFLRSHQQYIRVIILLDPHQYFTLLFKKQHFCWVCSGMLLPFLGDHLDILSWEVPVKIILPIFYLGCLFLLQLQEFLCNVGMSPLSDIHIVNIFSQSVASFFFFLNYLNGSILLCYKLSKCRVPSQAVLSIGYPE